MSTYLIRDDEGNAHVTEFGKPTPAHALTKSAKAARRSVRDAAAERRQRITRADVEAAYVHPAPEVPCQLLQLDRDWTSASSKSLMQLAERNGHRAEHTFNRGTTLPKWHVNSPDNKTNPGPPVDASQYHGEVVDVETVYVEVRDTDWESWLNATGKKGLESVRRIRGVWQNGNLDRIEVDGVETTLRAAREVLS